MKNVVLLLLLSFAYLGLAQETYTLSSDSKLTINGTWAIHDWTVNANSMTGNVAILKNPARTDTPDVPKIKSRNPS